MLKNKVMKTIHSLSNHERNKIIYEINEYSYVTRISYNSESSGCMLANCWANYEIFTTLSLIQGVQLIQRFTAQYIPLYVYQHTTVKFNQRYIPYY